MGAQSQQSNPTSGRISRRALLRRSGLAAGALLAGAMLPSAAAAEVLVQAAPSQPWFSLRVDDAEIAAFSELAELVTDDGSLDPLTFRKLPGQRMPPTIVLKRGTNSSSALWAWSAAVRQGDPVQARKSCELVMYQFDGQPVARYHLDNAWPSKIDIGNPRGGSTAVALALTLTCDHVRPVSP